MANLFNQSGAKRAELRLEGLSCYNYEVHFNAGEILREIRLKSCQGSVHARSSERFGLD